MKVQVGVIFDKKYYYRLLSAINSNVDFIINSIDFRYNMDSKIHAEFRDKYFNRCLSAINNNIDFIINSIDFQYNMDNKAFMQSLGIYIFIDTYQQLIATLIHAEFRDKHFYRRLDVYIILLFLKNEIPTKNTLAVK